jgi:hypothetical protein
VSEAPVEVDLDKVDECKDHDGEVYPPFFIRHGGVPFTGIVCDRQRGRITRFAYRNGQPHGDASTVGPEGKVHWRSQYRDGLEVGESWNWAADGTLRHYERHDDNGKLSLKQYFDETGTLRHEWTPDRQRTWYADGTLRSDRIDGLRCAFTRDGRRAFGEGVQTLTQAKVYDHFVFEDAVLRDAMQELLGDFEFQRGVWLWMQRRFDVDDSDAVEDLRKTLAHEQLEARSTALNMIGHRRLEALADEVRAMVDDTRVPPMRHGEYPNQGGRGHSVSIGQAARDALAKLGRDA